MIIDVLGTGESLSEYPPYTGNRKIGVNNITTFRQVDYLVLVDKPEVFRRKGTFHSVLEHKGVTATNLPNEWSQYFPWITPLQFANIRGHIDFSDGKVPWSNNSTFVAAAFAFKYFSPKEIHLYGVDFNTHHAFGPHDPLRHERALTDFSKLNNHMLKHGSTMKTTKTSALSAFLPIINH